MMSINKLSISTRFDFNAFLTMHIMPVLLLLVRGISGL
jgi:hypothetical protein